MALVLGILGFLGLNYCSAPSKNEKNLSDLSEARERTVSQLYIYPIKSCGGVALQSCKVVENGFEHDREWILARQSDGDEDWKMITQREYTTLVLVKPAVHNDDQDGSISLSITAPGMPLLRVRRSFDQVPCQISVWEDMVAGVDQGQEAANWFSDYLSLDNVRLFVKHPGQKRAISKKHTPSSDLFTYATQTGFADGFPFLFLGQESVDAFIEKSFTPTESRGVSAKNFRPNVVTKGGAPFEEDEWLHIKVAGHSFLVNSRCTRCEMTNNDPEKGQIPITSTTTTLKELMKRRRVDEGAKYEAGMGINVTHVDIGFEIRVRQKISILQTGLHDRRGIWMAGHIDSLKRYK